MRPILLTLQAFAILSVACGAAKADVTFVQMTDPHMFAKLGDPKPKDDVAENKRVLQWCIDTVNQRAAAGVKYDFAVITGDLGLEELCDNSKTTNAIDPKLLDAAAAELAGFLSKSSVKIWLFVPGNNDLINEDPSTIGHYHLFMADLQRHVQNTPSTKSSTAPAASKISVIDLCPENAQAETAIFQLKGCRFVGFDNSSFKSNNLANDTKEGDDEWPKKGAISFKDAQLKRIEELNARLAQGDFAHAFIFYHIPEVDDPFLVSPEGKKKLAEVTKQRKVLGDEFAYSAWMVSPDVRLEWNKVVTNDKVKGLFTGHFHSPNHAAYESWNWMLESKYPSGSLLKLSVCPPIAEKKQTTPLKARGFREVNVDCASGAIASQIFWYGTTTAAIVTPQPAPPAAAAPAPALWALGAPFTLLGLIGAVLIYLGNAQEGFKNRIRELKKAAVVDSAAIRNHSRAAALLVFPDIVLLTLLWLVYARIVMLHTEPEQAPASAVQACPQVLDVWILAVMAIALAVLTILHLVVDGRALAKWMKRDT